MLVSSLFADYPHQLENRAPCDPVLSPVSKLRDLDDDLTAELQNFRFYCGKLRLRPQQHGLATLWGGRDRSEIEKISKALADETRLRIFEEISARDQMNCSEIVLIQGVTPATVSHHLRILSEAGLIVCRRKGQFVFSHAVPETIAAYTQAIAKVARLEKVKRRRRIA